MRSRTAEESRIHNAVGPSSRIGTVMVRNMGSQFDDAATWWKGERTWHAIASGISADALLGLSLHMEREGPYLRKECPLPPWEDFASILGGASRQLAEVAVLHGPSACLPAIALYTPHVSEAIMQADSRYAAGSENWSLTKLSFLTFLQELRCFGQALPLDAEGAEARWLERLLAIRPRMEEADRFEAGFICILQGRTDLVRRFVRGGPLPRRLRPGQLFGRDIAALVRYLAVAVETQAGMDAIAPAWDDFLVQFPYLHTYRPVILNWYHLLLCGTIVLSVVGRRPRGTVADEVHNLVLRLAGAENGT